MKTKKLLGLAAAAFFGMSAYAQEPGDYFFKNVESGRYLNGANSWGTKASVTDHGQLMTLAAVDGGFTIDSHYSNGGNAHYLASGDNTYLDANPATHTLEAQVDGSYVIKDGNGKYLSSDGNLVNFNSDVINGASKWLLISKADVLKAAESASEDNPVDFTGFIGDANFSRNNQYFDAWVNKGAKGGDNGNMCVEKYHAVFNSYQTLTGMPNGKYRMTAQGFYRQDGSDNTNLPYFFINDESKTFPILSGTENNMVQASNSFTNGLYKIDAIEVIVSNGTITLGAKCEQTSLWCIWDNFELTYLGAVTDLSAYKPGYDKAVADATGVDQNAKMNASVLSALQSAISAYNVDFSTFTSADDISTAVTALSNAANAANASIANYAAVAAKLNTLDADGQAAFLATEVGQKYANKTYTDEDCTSDFATAVKAQTSDGADMTLAIVNPSFEDGFTGWTQSNLQTQDNNSFEKTGNTYAEKWHANLALDVNQTVTGLPKGKYRVTAHAQVVDAANETGLIYAGDESVSIISLAPAADYSVEVSVFDGSLTFGASCQLTNSSWFCVDNFRLVRVGEADEEPEVINVTAVTLENSSVSLNSTNNTATFVATVLPADATNKKIKWTSSDENVAKVDKDGVVTGVAPGTATITATSADNEEIKATATVTTSYSETTALPTTKTVEHVDGSKTVYTFSGVNIIKNGSFEYGDPFFGWTNGAGSALAADKFTAADGTITSKASEGNGGAGSVATKWSVDANTTYVFGYRTKANVEGNAQYQKVSLTNDGAETQVVSDNEQIVGTDWTDVQYIFTNEEYSGLQFRARWLANNVAFDDFYLMKVTNIEEIAAPAPTPAEVEIAHGTVVNASAADVDITYVRNFATANKWQSLYVPFDIDMSKVSSDIVIAKFEDIVEENGEVAINIVKASASEVIDAKTPLFIAAKTAGDKNINVGVSSIVEAEDGYVKFTDGTVYGLLEGKKAGIDGSYIMSGGSLVFVPSSMSNVKLGVNHWYLTLTNARAAKIRISAEGFSADEATAIANAVAESVENGEIFSINGAKVNDAKSGLYIKGGKKIYVK